jgi:peptide chain release factor subunit 1
LSELVPGKGGSIDRYRFKRLLDGLSSKEGRGTEMITLYIPPGKRIHEVMANLREEYGTASNIKSRTTRKSVLDAIERVMQKLKLFRETPPNGLAIFCGAIPQNGPGTERMETYVFEPPEPINIYYYRCDSRFHTEPLLELLKEKDIYGIIVIDSSQAIVATLEGRRLEVLKELTSGIGGKHRAGGQSARRFERIREQELNDYFRRVGSHANELLSGIDRLRGILIGGPGPTKNEFLEGDYVNYELKKKILAIVDTAYVAEQGAKEVVDKSHEILRGVRYSEERGLVQRFLREVGHDTGLASYGEGHVRGALRDGAVEILLLSEGIETLRVRVACNACGHEEQKILEPHELAVFESNLPTMNCSACGSQGMRVLERRRLLEEFIELAEGSGAKIELISTETEEGAMLLKSFKGIAAILKYRIA